MVIFLTAAVTISATRAAGRVGKLNQDPGAPEGAPGLNAFRGPAVPSCIPAAYIVTSGRAKQSCQESYFDS